MRLSNSDKAILNSAGTFEKIAAMGIGINFTSSATLKKTYIPLSIHMPWHCVKDAGSNQTFQLSRLLIWNVCLLLAFSESAHISLKPQQNGSLTQECGENAIGAALTKVALHYPPKLPLGVRCDPKVPLIPESLFGG